MHVEYGGVRNSFNSVSRYVGRLVPKSFSNTVLGRQLFPYISVNIQKLRKEKIEEQISSLLLIPDLDEC